MNEIDDAGSRARKRTIHIQLCAELLLYVYSSIQSIDFTTAEAIYRQEDAVDWLQQKLSVFLPKLEIGFIEQFLRLGPFHPENLEEATNRVANLFFSLMFVLAPTRFKGAFGAQVLRPYANEMISRDHMLAWMVSEEAADDTASNTICQYYLR